MFMIMFVLDDSSNLDQLLTAWSKQGISGTTIVDSTGLHRRLQHRIPMRYLYGEAQLEGKGNTTLFTVVENEELVQICLQVAEQIVGDLNKPNTGIFVAWPVIVSKGVPVSNFLFNQSLNSF